MNDEIKQAYIDKMSAQLREWSSMINVVKARLDKASATERIKLHSQLEGWNQKELLFKQKIEELRAASLDGFEKIKLTAQATWNELTTLMKSTGEKEKENQ